MRESISENTGIPTFQTSRGNENWLEKSESDGREMTIGLCYRKVQEIGNSLFVARYYTGIVFRSPYVFEHLKNKNADLK